MITNQSVEILYDTDRKRSFLFVAKDMTAIQSYQIPLIDAYIAAVDYLPMCSYLVCPTVPKQTGILFRDTYFVEPHDVVEPEALILDDGLVQKIFGDVSHFIGERDILTTCSKPETLAVLRDKWELQLVGIKKVDDLT